MSYPEVVHSGPTPVYLQIKSWIRQQIEHGVWPEHFKLESEADLAAASGVSRGTVRKAITELIEEGMLVRIHGRGTFVASGRLEQPLAERLVAFSEDLIDKGIPFETQVLDCSVIDAPPHVASLFSVPLNSEVFFLKRIRSIAKSPLILLENYVVYQRCPGIEKVDFTKYRLFQALEELFGLKLDWGRRYFEARAADEDMARYLDISVCDPVMSLEQIVYLDDGSPIEFSDAWLRGDRFRLSATVRRSGSSQSSLTQLEFL